MVVDSVESVELVQEAALRVFVLCCWRQKQQVLHPLRDRDTLIWVLVIEFSLSYHNRESIVNIEVSSYANFFLIP